MEESFALGQGSASEGEWARAHQPHRMDEINVPEGGSALFRLCVHALCLGRATLCVVKYVATTHKHSTRWWHRGKLEPEGQSTFPCNTRIRTHAHTHQWNESKHWLTYSATWKEIHELQTYVQFKYVLRRNHSILCFPHNWYEETIFFFPTRSLCLRLWFNWIFSFCSIEIPKSQHFFTHSSLTNCNIITEQQKNKWYTKRANEQINWNEWFCTHFVVIPLFNDSANSTSPTISFCFCQSHNNPNKLKHFVLRFLLSKTLHLTPNK